MTTDQMHKALNKAFQLGQTYSQQADSDSYKQNAKSDDTMAMFKSLIADTLAAIAQTEQPTAQPTITYPVDDIVGPCICGSWPGGKCLRCEWLPAQPESKA